MIGPQTPLRMTLFADNAENDPQVGTRMKLGLGQHVCTRWESMFLRAPTMNLLPTLCCVHLAALCFWQIVKVIDAELVTKPLYWQSEPEPIVMRGLRVSLPGANRVLSLAEIRILGKEIGVPEDCVRKHCGHGNCEFPASKGTCNCVPDWIGRDCSSNVRSDVRYMPLHPEADGRSW